MARAEPTRRVLRWTVTAGDGGPGEAGGGIRNAGTLTIQDSVITGNTAGAGGRGGNARGKDGQFNQTIRGFDAGFGQGGKGGAGGAGGGVFDTGALTLMGVTVTGNLAGPGGHGGAGTGGNGGGSGAAAGGDAGFGEGGNGGGGGVGGGIAETSRGSLTMNDSSVSGNSAGAGGDGGLGGGGAGWLLHGHRLRREGTASASGAPPLATLARLTRLPCRHTRSGRRRPGRAHFRQLSSPVRHHRELHLNQPATVRFAVTRVLTGRLGGGGHCVAPSPSNRRARKCTRLVTVHGAFTQSGQLGANSFRFTGRIAGHRLLPGAYPLLAIPGAGATRGLTATTGFRIITPAG